MRRPWPWFAIALVATAFGFWPSFFSSLGSVRTAILIHGFSATLWMALTAQGGLGFKPVRRRFGRMSR